VQGVHNYYVTKLKALVHNDCPTNADLNKKTDAKNPYGSKGKPDHQAKVEELAKKAEGELKEGEKLVREKGIQLEGSNRRPDVQIVDKDGKTRKVFEAERHPNRKRNRTREAEYDSLGIEQETHGL